MMRILLFTLLINPSLVLANCRQALVLALDVSGSVDAQEYGLQINGLADALDAPQIRDLILSGGDPIAITVFEFSSQNHQGLIVPWTDFRNHQDIDQLVNVIRSHTKQRQGLKTAIGRAMQYAGALLNLRPDCVKHTVDISADGKNNAGPYPHDVYCDANFQDVTVNALVVDLPSISVNVTKILSQLEIESYYKTHVIHGPGAFTMPARGYQDYARAMQEKLKRELGTQFFSRLDLGEH